MEPQWPLKIAAEPKEKPLVPRPAAPYVGPDHPVCSSPPSPRIDSSSRTIAQGSRRKNYQARSPVFS